MLTLLLYCLQFFRHHLLSFLYSILSIWIVVVADKKNYRSKLVIPLVACLVLSSVTVVLDVIATFGVINKTVGMNERGYG